jgi:hypothetical protein
MRVEREGIAWSANESIESNSPRRWIVRAALASRWAWTNECSNLLEVLRLP